MPELRGNWLSGRVAKIDVAIQGRQARLHVEPLSEREMVKMGIDIVDNVRPAFDYQVQFVRQYLAGTGLDMGCGSCPLQGVDDCWYIDHSSQPLCEIQVPIGRFIKADAILYRHPNLVDFIFSSHMVEDLPSREAIIDCLLGWSTMLRKGGHIVLLLPDMQGGRYPTVEEGGNCSHQVNVGKQFIENILPDLFSLDLVQIDKIPHDKSVSIDVVFRRKDE
jgi:hypothetical protein